MVWYGMVWYVWYGMVWYGMVWYGAPTKQGHAVPVPTLQWPQPLVGPGPRKEGAGRNWAALRAVMGARQGVRRLGGEGSEEGGHGAADMAHGGGVCHTVGHWLIVEGWTG